VEGSCVEVLVDFWCWILRRVDLVAGNRFVAHLRLYSFPSTTRDTEPPLHLSRSLDEDTPSPLT